jgi:hypothetical protein
MSKKLISVALSIVSGAAIASGAASCSNSDNGGDAGSGSSGGSGSSSGGGSSGSGSGSSSGGGSSGSGSGSSSGGGSGSSGGIDSGGSSDASDAGPTYTLIDNMSGGPTVSGPLKCPGCNGSWYNYGDPSGATTPSINAFLYTAFTPPLTTVFSTTAESNASRLASTKPFGGFGAGMGFFYKLSVPADAGADATVSVPMPLDVSAYTGISFYAMASADAGATTLHVLFPDINTDPNGHSADGGSICTACFDHFGTTVALTTTWTQYTVPFNGLMQAGFGAPKPTALDTKNAFGIVFQINGPGCPAPTDGGTICVSADGGSLGTPVSFDVSVTALYFTK